MLRNPLKTTHDDRSEILFGALLATMFLTFIIGNIIFWRLDLIQSSLPILLFGMAFVVTLRFISKKLNLLWALVILYSVLLVCVYIKVTYIIYFIYLISSLCAVQFALTSRIILKKLHHILFMAVMGTALVFGIARSYTSFDMINRLHSGDIHQDTLFHASIAAMIKNYNISSTALHGLIEVYYHTFSHALFAGISTFSGVSVIETYGFATPIIFIPLLIYCLSSLVSSRCGPRKTSVVLTWSITIVILALTPVVFSSWGLWNSYFVSESYLVSLTLFILALDLLYRKSLKISDIVLAVLYTVLITKAKGSVGLVYALLWFVRAFFKSDVRITVNIAIFMLLFIAALLSIYDSATSLPGGLQFESLHFIKYFSLFGEALVLSLASIETDGFHLNKNFVLALLAIFSYLVFHYVATWILIAIRQTKHAALEENYHLTLWFSVFSAAIGATLSLALIIPGGSAYYFSNVAYFVSLPTIIYIVACRIEDSQIRTPSYLVVMLSITLAIGLKGYSRNVDRATRSDHVISSPLINYLSSLREVAPKDYTYHATDELLVLNPVMRCTAAPFVFPAVSERPWMGVFLSNVPCDYKYYGFEMYRSVIYGY